MRILALVSTLAALLAAPAVAGTDTLYVCQDRDNDGRFGLVEVLMEPARRDANVLRGNIGTYQSCVAAMSGESACSGAGTLCACEDRDRDGRFGIVRHPYPTTGRNVVAPNVGNYFACQNRMNT